MTTAVVIFQYLLGIVAPLLLVVLVAWRTRPGLVRRMGMIGFGLLTLAGCCGIAGVLSQRAEVALLQGLFTFAGVITAIVAVIIGAIQSKAEHV